MKVLMEHINFDHSHLYGKLYVDFASSFTRACTLSNNSFQSSLLDTFYDFKMSFPILVYFLRHFLGHICKKKDLSLNEMEAHIQLRHKLNNKLENMDKHLKESDHDVETVEKTHDLDEYLKDRDIEMVFGFECADITDDDKLNSEGAEEQFIENNEKSADDIINGETTSNDREKFQNVKVM